MMEMWRKDWRFIMKIPTKSLSVKHMFIIALCYIFASWGVNGVINPIHYLRNSGDIHPVQMEEQEECVYIDLSQISQDEYVLFEFGSLNTVVNSVEITLLRNDGTTQSDTLKVFQGIVSYKIDPDLLGIKISHKEFQKCDLVLNQVRTGKYKVLDCFSMIKIFIIFLCLTIFWNLNQVIKRKYA